MRYLSLFSGIESASIAWIPLGWECVGVAEIEPFPCKVLAHHYPGVPNLGSVTEITEAQVKALGHIDLVVGGFPCQDLSVAGKRRGLRHEDGSATRSGLFFTAMQIVEWASPRWVVVENVPGLFSSAKGADFASVVGEMAGCEFDVPRNGWRNSGVAIGDHGLVEWVTLDAQFCRTPLYPRAVPQRRRRVFVIRDSGDWSSRPPLFPISESLSGNPPPRRSKGKEVAADVASCIRASGVGTERIGREPQNGGNGTGFDESGASYTLTKTDVHAVAFNVYGGNKRPDRPEGGFYVKNEDTSKTLDTQTGLNPNCSQGGTGVIANMQVRRLTPTECARLQGFPDDYLPQVPGYSDSAAYKALGNSMACNVMQLIGQRIQAVDNIV